MSTVAVNYLIAFQEFVMNALRVEMEDQINAFMIQLTHANENNIKTKINHLIKATGANKKQLYQHTSSIRISKDTWIKILENKEQFLKDSGLLKDMIKEGRKQKLKKEDVFINFKKFKKNETTFNTEQNNKGNEKDAYVIGGKKKTKKKKKRKNRKSRRKQKGGSEIVQAANILATSLKPREIPNPVKEIDKAITDVIKQCLESKKDYIETSLKKIGESNSFKNAVCVKYAKIFKDQIFSEKNWKDTDNVEQYTEKISTNSAKKLGEYVNNYYLIHHAYNTNSKIKSQINKYWEKISPPNKVEKSNSKFDILGGKQHNREKYIAKHNIGNGNVKTSQDTMSRNDGIFKYLGGR